MLCLSKFTDGEANQQRLNNSGIRKKQAAGGGGFRRSHLKRFQSKATSSHQEFLLSSREMLVRECARLASAIRRAAAGCVAPSSAGGADEDDDGLPYMQLDKVTHEVSREAFGPLYLVT
jgi:hypothetical protein